MQMLIAILAGIHGLIHFIGWAGSTGRFQIKGLTLSVARSAGWFWLICGLLMTGYAVLQGINHNSAWILGAVSVFFSQLLILKFWKDAKFGSIPNLLIAVAVFSGWGFSRLQSEFEDKVKKNLAAQGSEAALNLEEEDISHLPEQVRRYLRYSGCIGKPMVRNFRATFSGRMRSAPGEEFMNLTSVQYNFCKEPSRYFFMESSKMGIPATGLHLYADAKATFRVKLLNWFPVVDAAGPQLDQAETVTLLNDMCFIAPATLIDRRIEWEPVNYREVRAIFTNKGIKVSARVLFNDEGKLINFISDDRFHTDGKTYTSYRWSTPVEGVWEKNGTRLPAKAKLIYHRPEGEFTYGELEFRDVQYNVSALIRP